MNKFVESLKYTYLYDIIFPMIQILQTLNWYLKRKSSFTPHLVKQLIVKSYQKKYKPQILIETGTYLGTMVNATKNNFDKIYTIELDEKLYKLAKNKFKDSKHIKVIFGDSVVSLPKLLRTIRKPSLFWLDAHYSKGITKRGSKETPVTEELNTILRSRVKNHIILIDDANEFIGKNDYPHLENLKKYISTKYPNLIFEVKYNIIRITPKDLTQMDDSKHF